MEELNENDSMFWINVLNNMLNMCTIGINCFWLACPQCAEFVDAIDNVCFNFKNHLIENSFKLILDKFLHSNYVDS